MRRQHNPYAGFNGRQLLRVLAHIVDLANAPPKPAAPAVPLVDPDSELRAEVQQALRAEGLTEAACVNRTAGDKLLVEAKRLGLL